MPSSHDIIALIEKKKAWYPDAPRLVIGDSTLTTFFEIQQMPEGDVINPYTFDGIGYLDLDTDPVLSLDILYRDQGNNKQHDQAFIKGPFTQKDIALIITALTAGDYDSFIPNQIGLMDLQGRWGEPSFDDGYDSVWHEITRMSSLDSSSLDMCGLTMEEWRPMLEAIIATGYDEDKALTEWMDHAA